MEKNMQKSIKMRERERNHPKRKNYRKRTFLFNLEFKDSKASDLLIIIIIIINVLFIFPIFYFFYFIYFLYYNCYFYLCLFAF